MIFGIFGKTSHWRHSTVQQISMFHVSEKNASEKLFLLDAKFQMTNQGCRESSVEAKTGRPRHPH